MLKGLDPDIRAAALSHWEPLTAERTIFFDEITFSDTDMLVAVDLPIGAAAWLIVPLGLGGLANSFKETPLQAQHDLESKEPGAGPLGLMDPFRVGDRKSVV